MRRWLFLVFTLFFIIFAEAVSAYEPVEPEPTRVETDSERGEINFYIDGELTAVLKRDGFHIRENVNFGGALTDYGQSHFDALHTNQRDNEGEE